MEEERHGTSCVSLVVVEAKMSHIGRTSRIPIKKQDMYSV